MGGPSTAPPPPSGLPRGSGGSTADARLATYTTKLAVAISAKQSAYFGMLDSHVVNAQVRPRMSPEEKWAKEVQRRRLADEERCSRIFNIRFRTMGLDTETLD